MRPGRFRPGQSGNPGGRPKEIGHVKELAREHTVAAVKTLAEIMGNTGEPAAARARAAEALLNRAWTAGSRSLRCHAIAEASACNRAANAARSAGAIALAGAFWQIE